MADRTFVTEFKRDWPYAIDHVGNVQAGESRYEPISPDVTEWHYIFWHAHEDRGAKPGDRRVRTYTLQDKRLLPDKAEVIPDYGIKAVLKDMQFLDFADPYKYLVYIATGIGRVNTRNGAGRRTVTAAISDLRVFGIDIPAGAAIAGDHVVLFQE